MERLNFTNLENEWNLLNALENRAETSQADLAKQAGLAVGTVNWYLKKWSDQGYVNVKRVDRWRWHYLLTAEGMQRKATLVKSYLEVSMRLYRETRSQATRLLTQVKSMGYEQVYISGEGEIADICRLTCIEIGVQVAASHSVSDSDTSPEFPALLVQELSVHLRLPTTLAPNQ